jgi:hypothetical protein
MRGVYERMHTVPVEYPEEEEAMESERGEKPSNTSLDQLPPPSVECQ